MDATFMKLYSGDYSVLDHILVWVERPQLAPYGETGQRLYAFLGSLLCLVGQQMKRFSLESQKPRGNTPNDPDFIGVTPPPACWTALSILASVGTRQGADGVACRAALLALGLHHCREMFLDAYFIDRAERDSLVAFVCILANIYGCRMGDLLRRPQNIVYMEVSAIPSLNIRVLFPTRIMQRNVVTSDTNSALTNSPNTNDNSNAPMAHRMRLAADVQPRTASIPLRSSLMVPVIGLSGDTLTNSNRRYRALPKKPASTPYATNPLYNGSIKPEENTVLAAQFPAPVVRFSNFFGLGCEPRIPTVKSFFKRQHVIAKTMEDVASGAVSKAVVAPVHALLGIPNDTPKSGDDNHSSDEVDTPQNTPGQLLAPLLTPTALAQDAQLQTATENLLRVQENVRDTAKTKVASSGFTGTQMQPGTHSSPPLLNPAGTAATSSPSPSKAGAAAVAASNRSGAAVAQSSGDQAACCSSHSKDAVRKAVDASLLFVECNDDPAVVALNARCVTCSLLNEYLNNGKLLGWGENTFHALGPIESEAHRNTSTSPQRVPPSPPPQLRGQKNGSTPPPALTASTVTPAVGSSPDRAGGLLAAGGGTCSTAVVDAAAPSGRSPLSAPIGSHPHLSSASAMPLAVGSSSVGTIVGSTSGPDYIATSMTAAPYCYTPCIVRQPETVVDVACGMLSTHIITHTGLLFSCGRAQVGQLGIGDRALERADTGAERFQKASLSKDEQVVMVFAGCGTAAAVTRDGHVYCWGANAYGQCLRMRDSIRVLLPIRFKSGKFKPTTLSFGVTSAGVLYDDGLVGVWGALEMIGKLVPVESAEPALTPGDKLCVRKIISLPAVFDAPVAVLRMGPEHILVVSRSGTVYTWGKGHEGRLGHGSDQDEAKPRIVEGLQQAIILDGSCGAMHTAVVDATGLVHVFGENRYGQLGLRGLQARRTPVHLPLPAPALAVSCGQMCTCMLLETGDVMACGPASVSGVGLGQGRLLVTPSYILHNYVMLRLASGPTHSVACGVNRTAALMRVGHSPIEELSRMESLAVRSGVRDVAVGLGFVLVLSENGSMVALGRGERGQLGVGPAMRPSRAGEITVVSSFEAVRMPAAAAVEFVAVTCGPDFVFALDQSARVYGWGSNEKELLTLPPSVTAVYEPTLITAYEGRGILQMACGNSFVIALTDEGEVLTHGEYVYCGLSSAIEAPTRTANKAGGVRVLTPSAVPGLRQVVAIAAGKFHSVAMTAACVIYAWGKGVLGNGSSTSAVAYAPVKVALSQSVRKLGCGPFSSYVINDVGDLFVWGYNEQGQCGVAARPRKKRGSDAAAAVASEVKQNEDESSVAALVVPTRVARRVRDAAFATKFGLVLFEDGAIRASGRLRHGGQDYHLNSFSDTPQPVFTVDVNAPRRGHRGKGIGGTGRNSTSHEGGGGGGGSGDAGPQRGRRMSEPANDSVGGSVSGCDARQLAAGETFFTPSRNTSMLHPRPPSTPQEKAEKETFAVAEDEEGVEQWRMTRASRDPLCGSMFSTTTVLSASGTHTDADDSPQRRLSVPPPPKPSASPTVTSMKLSLKATTESTAAPLPTVKGVLPRPSSSMPALRPPKEEGHESGDGTRTTLPPQLATPPVRPLTSAPVQQQQQQPPPSAPLTRPPRPVPAAAATTTTTESPLVEQEKQSRPSSSSSSVFTGLRCFGGWEQVFALVEKHRPSAEEVRLAYRGLQVYLRQKEVYEDDVV